MTVKVNMTFRHQLIESCTRSPNEPMEGESSLHKHVKADPKGIRETLGSRTGALRV